MSIDLYLDDPIDSHQLAHAPNGWPPHRVAVADPLGVHRCPAFDAMHILFPEWNLDATARCIQELC